MKGYTAKLFGAVAAGMLLTALAPMLAFAGWNSGDGYWYMYEPGKVYCDEFAEIDGYVYSFDENGYMETGWIQDTENALGLGANSWCYADSSGALVKNQWVGDCLIDQWGIAYQNSGTYLYGGQLRYSYYFDENCHLIPNEWYQYSDGWCLWLGNQSWAMDEIVAMDGVEYYFDADGYMVTDAWCTYKGNQYYFDSSGAKVLNQWIDGIYYVCNTGKRIETGLLSDGYRIDHGKWDGEDPVFTWKQSSNGKWWIEFTDGTYPTGFTPFQDGKGYYFDENGYMLTGWILDDDTGCWFYAEDNGCLKGSEWFDNMYYFSGFKMVTDNYVIPFDVEIGLVYVGPDGKYDVNKSKWVNALA